MSRTVSILDFDDSFTFNIASEFLTIATSQQLDFDINVIPKREIEEFLRQIDQFPPTSRQIIVYGPGPGHPQEYSNLLPLIKPILDQKKLFHVGICLGHQILWGVHGYQTHRSAHPAHGQRVAVRIPAWPDRFDSSVIGKKVWVQRYNSLVVDIKENRSNNRLYQFHFEQRECLLGSFERGVTFQFHPESVGTSFPQIFLSSSIEFLYNKLQK